ncbi:hypothetical protein [Amycolatopsis orientalis]|uniref:hypothetical protein n=1 Tax=Amycolatopsis orientalis TaxID=31958 RepID=UPI0003A2D0CF|nr:hypothetical protein [Amycolatopsis orientalis]
MNRRPKRVAGRLSAPEPAKRASRLQTLLKGPKRIVAAVATLLLAAVVPWAAPWLVDRGKDVFGGEPVTASSHDFPDVVAGRYWATAATITGQPESVGFEIFQREGAQLGVSGHEIALTSNRSGRIDLVRITAVVEQRLAPLSGTAYVQDPQGTAEEPIMDFHLDSGDDVPALVAGPDPDRASRPYLADGKLQYLESGQTLHLILRGSTHRCFCTWRVRIEYSYRGDRRTLTLPPPGSPGFKTTAWGFHRVEYNQNTADGGGAKRFDCTSEPAKCRTAPR